MKTIAFVMRSDMVYLLPAVQAFCMSARDEDSYNEDLEEARDFVRRLIEYAIKLQAFTYRATTTFASD